MPILAKKSPQNESAAVSGKKRRKWPFFAAAAVVLAAGLFVGLRGQSTPLTISPTDTALLVRADLQDSVSTTGTVESAKSMTVYSTKAYTVQEVFVEEGDRVEEGQLLCKLDDQNIRNQIETQQASLDASASSSDAAIHAARDNYEQFRESLEKGTNASLISAENAVTNAYNAYLAAKDTYDRYLSGLELGENTTLLAQETALSNARKGVENAYQAYEDALEAAEDAGDAYEDAEEALEEGEDALWEAEESLEELQQELEEAEEALERLQEREAALAERVEEQEDALQKAELQAQLTQVQGEIERENLSRLTLELQAAQAESAYSAAYSAVSQLEAALTQRDQAWEMAEKQAETCAEAILTAEESLVTVQKQYNAAVTGVDNILADYAKNVENAHQAYETAQASLEAARISAQNQLQAYENNLNSAYASAGRDTMEVSLRQMQAELAGTEITAPMSGTVTAVYAQVGSAGSGLLFVVEDTENFVISTSVKDYDIAAVSVGTAASIRSDATGDDLYEGEVTYIAPTANKTAMGVTDTSGDISFAADVKVNSAHTRLRIGLNVRLNLIVAEERGALAAPYDAIYTNSHGQDCVLVAEQQAEGSWLLREQPVELGLETDLDVSIKGDGLTEGMTVISSPEQYAPYIGQAVHIGAAARQGLLGGF